MAFGDKYERGGILPEVDVHDHDAYRQPRAGRIHGPHGPGIRASGISRRCSRSAICPGKLARTISTTSPGPAQIMVDRCDRQPGATGGLRKLLESKDCMGGQR